MSIASTCQRTPRRQHRDNGDRVPPFETCPEALTVSYAEYSMEIRLSSIQAVRSDPVRYIARWEIDTGHSDPIQWSMFVKMPRESQQVWESYTEIMHQAHVQMEQALATLRGQVSQLHGRIR